jgi:hypothetical protein
MNLVRKKTLNGSVERVVFAGITPTNEMAKAVRAFGSGIKLIHIQAIRRWKPNFGFVNETVKKARGEGCVVISDYHERTIFDFPELSERIKASNPSSRHMVWTSKPELLGTYEDFTNFAIKWKCNSAILKNVDGVFPGKDSSENLLAMLRLANDSFRHEKSGGRGCQLLLVEHEPSKYLHMLHALELVNKGKANLLLATTLEQAKSIISNAGGLVGLVANPKIINRGKVDTHGFLALERIFRQKAGQAPIIAYSDDAPRLKEINWIGVFP